VKKKIAYSVLKKLLWMKKNIGGYAVITYHNIASNSEPRLYDLMTIKEEEFLEQLELLSNEFSILSVDEIVRRIKQKVKPDKLYIGITFDDGFITQKILAVPLLKKYSIPATFFITTDFADQKVIPQMEKWKYWIINSNQIIDFIHQGNIRRRHDLRNNSNKYNFYNYLINTFDPESFDNKNLNESMQSIFGRSGISRMYMNWNEISEISKNPIFTIGAHSRTHRNLTKVKNLNKDELVKSKTIIEKKINKQVSLFAYPFGTIKEINNYVIKSMESSGFDAAFSSIQGLNTGHVSPFLLNRIASLGFETADQLMTKIYWSNEIMDAKIGLRSF